MGYCVTVKMAPITNLFRISIYPGGTWVVSHIRGDQISRVAQGRSDTMKEAENAARAWVNEKNAARKREREESSPIQRFTMAAEY